MEKKNTRYINDQIVWVFSQVFEINLLFVSAISKNTVRQLKLNLFLENNITSHMVVKIRGNQTKTFCEKRRTFW